MNIYRKEIKAWQQIRNGDSGGFQRLPNSLIKYECKYHTIKSQELT